MKDVNWSDAVNLLLKIPSLFGGASMWSLITMAVAGLGAVAGIGYLIKKNNDRIDSQERERAGADAGESSTDLRRQAEAGAQEERESWEKFKNKGGPK